MSRRREILHYRHSLQEIGEIMKAMKNMALVEVRKLAKFSGVQRDLILALEEMAKSFFGAHPELLPPTRDEHPIFLLLGSERGFCADFNSSLARFWLERVQSIPEKTAYELVVVGGRLESRTTGFPKTSRVLSGPSVWEEVADFLPRLMGTVRDLVRTGSTGLTVLFHEPDQDRIEERRLLPVPIRADQLPRRIVASPPLLQIPARQFSEDLSETYLLAGLHEALYSSLAAENRKRMEHMQTALDRLDKRVAELTGLANRLRQEEITEEIEVILLSAEALERQKKMGSGSNH
ncbi:F-type H+-transporting ATPase subunit gamma [Methylacidimicrobium cyclopophantes]|uniref:F-type H+-transporting ATPase subunit gamma n=1 Tax=Methylacidimicrobium cyclopophantes TaxID=1041766 RepID=A0A5E6MC73_9BACT|nr:FoF1 ATP synthase subunit gamma [Methylacidimicrobium cyclopophantes]VVM05925.1 F-type H+-transporting ATPase subunit gamma [Methylacidimicrobium cyclopophantes]